MPALPNRFAKKRVLSYTWGLRPTLDNIAGNYIIPQIAPNRFVTYVHLRRESIRMQTGSRVHRGDVIALFGNSGNTTGANFHLQMTDRNSVLPSQGVPFVFANFTYLKPGSDYPEKKASPPWLDSIPLEPLA